MAVGGRNLIVGTKLHYITAHSAAYLHLSKANSVVHNTAIIAFIGKRTCLLAQMLKPLGKHANEIEYLHWTETCQPKLPILRLVRVIPDSWHYCSNHINSYMVWKLKPILFDDFNIPKLLDSIFRFKNNYKLLFSGIFFLLFITKSTTDNSLLFYLWANTFS